MLVRNALVARPFVVTTSTTLFAFIDQILASNQTTAAVVEGEALRGIVSATDVLKMLLPSYVQMDAHLAHVLHHTYFEERLDQLRSVVVAAAMVTAVDTLPPDAPVMAAVALFVGRGRKTVPVVDNGRFLGSVTRRSILTLVRGAASD